MGLVPLRKYCDPVGKEHFSCTLSRRGMFQYIVNLCLDIHRNKSYDCHEVKDPSPKNCVGANVSSFEEAKLFERARISNEVSSQCQV